ACRMFSRDRAWPAHLRRVLAALALIVALAGVPVATAAGDGSRATHFNIGWQSRNWAGYVVEDGPYTSVSGQWIVPSVSTSQTGFSAAWRGVEGVENEQLIQVGTEHDAWDGRSRYWAWWEILPAPAVRITFLTIRPGDRITASIRRVSGHTWR